MKTFTLAAITLATLGAIVAPQAAQAKKAPAAPVVRMETVKGVILIKLFPKEAPLSTANFIKLVNKGFYNGLTFHRIADLDPNSPSKIVQGGDPEGNGQGGPGWEIKGEFTSNGVKNPLKHVAGAFAMARSDSKDSAGSQFYICVNPVPFLDGNYAVFGQVLKGLDVAAKLQVGDKMTKVTMQK
ncbi:MAG: peptidylprolyl isomerase [Capsulimonas sp.]|jgi:peptidyl-prolyl cis-trans isomerase B (cyclophilin B)|nr:peptidylprolyl isomerase [Capsulimonas sp.]